MRDVPSELVGSERLCGLGQCSFIGAERIGFELLSASQLFEVAASQVAGGQLSTAFLESIGPTGDIGLFGRLPPG